MASPFQQMQSQAMEGLYGMGLTGEMDINEIRRRQQQMQQFSSRAQGIFGRSAFQPQTQSMGFSDMGGFRSGMPNMPYSSTMMGTGPMSSLGSGSTGSQYSNWSSMGQAPRFPYSGMMY